MDLNVTLIGTTPLVVHNIRLANPHDEFTQSIGRLTSKAPKQKTEQDIFDIEKLEWFGGLYYDEAHGYYLEGHGIKRCLIEAAKATREGKNVDRGVQVVTARVPIQFPKQNHKPEQLWEHEEHRFWKMVRVGRGMVPRMRPIFPEWRLDFPVELATELLDFSALEEIMERAAKVEGLYEARKLGFGRFRASIVAVEPNGKPKRKAEKKEAAQEA